MPPSPQVLLILRTWALYGRNSRILLLLIGTMLTLLGVAAVSSPPFHYPFVNELNPVIP